MNLSRDDIITIIAVVSALLSIKAYIDGRGQRKATEQGTNAGAYKNLSDTVTALSNQIDEYRKENQTLRADVQSLNNRLEQMSIELERSDAAFIFVTKSIRDSQPIIVGEAMRIRRGQDKSVGHSAA